MTPNVIDIYHGNTVNDFDIMTARAQILTRQTTSHYTDIKPRCMKRPGLSMRNDFCTSDHMRRIKIADN